MQGDSESNLNWDHVVEGLIVEMGMPLFTPMTQQESNFAVLQFKFISMTSVLLNGAILSRCSGISIFLLIFKKSLLRSF